MHISNCFKNRNTLKCSSYPSTIKRIKEAFGKLGLKLKITTYRYNSRLGLFSAKIEIPELFISTNGKGRSINAAIASGLGEMAERFSANFFFVTGSFLSSENPYASELANLKKYSNLSGYEEGYQEEFKNAIKISDLLSPLNDLTKGSLEEIQSNEICQNWVDGYSLLNQKKVKVPLQLVEIISGSNGLAAGNKLEEAISQASHEIIERYTVIKIVKNRKKVPTFAKNTIKDKKIKKILRKMEEKGLIVSIKDFSLNGKFPSAISTLFHNLNVPKEEYTSQWDQYSLNGGSSFNLYSGVYRCLSEKIAGFSLEKFSGGIQKKFFEIYLDKLEYQHKPINTNYRTLVRKHWFGGDLSFLAEGKEIEFPYFEESYNYKSDIERIKDICRNIGKDIIVINLTHPILNFPVVRVIIPGISDVIRFSYPTTQKLIDTLAMMKPTAKFSESKIKTLNSSNWLENRQQILKVIDSEIQSLIDNEFQTPAHSYLIPKNKIKILLSLYYKIEDYKRFSATCKFLATSEKTNWKYLYLHRMTEVYLKDNDQGILEIIKSVYENKLKGCDRYLVAEPMQNPFTTWCDNECKMHCEQRYVAKLNQIVETYYPKNSCFNKTNGKKLCEIAPEITT